MQASTVRGGIRVEQALTWSFPEPLTPAAAEALGKKLRDALKEANVAAAPVLACVGRERVILKELRYPAVPANEEPAIVRFQAAKELTESPDDSIIDYTPMGNGTASGERHALAVIVRKEVVNSLQGLCRGLGMKLLAVTPRPAAVDRMPWIVAPEAEGAGGRRGSTADDRPAFWAEPWPSCAAKLCSSPAPWASGNTASRRSQARPGGVQRCPASPVENACSIT